MDPTTSRFNATTNIHQHIPPTPSDHKTTAQVEDGAPVVVMLGGHTFEYKKGPITIPRQECLRKYLRESVYYIFESLCVSALREPVWLLNKVKSSIYRIRTQSVIEQT